MQALMKVPFYGDTLEACGTSREDAMVSIRRVCEALGIESSAQMQKLKGKAWATVTMIDMVAEDGKPRQHAMIALKSLPMWMATINAKKVSEHLVEKLARYQKEAHDVLAAYFLKQEMPEKQEQFPAVPNALETLVALLTPVAVAFPALTAALQQMVNRQDATDARLAQLEAGSAAAYRLTPSQRAMKAAELVGLTQQQAAERMGICDRTVRNAHAVKRKLPQLASAVNEGRIDVATAAKASRLPATEREMIARASDPKAAAMRLLRVG